RRRPGLSLVEGWSGGGGRGVWGRGPRSKKPGSEPVAIVKESLPPPPVIEIELMPASGRLLVEPSTVSVSDVASAATEIVCADESARDSVHGAGTGGEGPLPGFEAGSIDGRVALLGVVVESVGATGVAVVLEPVDELDEEPVAPALPGTTLTPVFWVPPTSCGPLDETDEMSVGPDPVGAPGESTASEVVVEAGVVSPLPVVVVDELTEPPATDPPPGTLTAPTVPPPAVVAAP